MLVTQDTDSLAWQLIPMGCQADGLTDRQESVLEKKSTYWGFLACFTGINIFKMHCFVGILFPWVTIA